MSAAAPSPRTEGSRVATGAIDCDVHQELVGVRDLLPYLDDKWKHYVLNGGFRGAPGFPYAVWMGPDRLDTAQPDGTRGSAHYPVLREQHLDHWGLEYAILTGPAAFLGICGMPQQEFASGLASANNDLVIEEWLPRDTRLRGSINIAGQDPIAAAREIDRVGGHPQMVQVILPIMSSGLQWADEKYHPIWEAAQRNGLPVGFHLLGSSGMMHPPTSAGWPRSFMEISSSYPLTAQAELIGFVCRGLFERFPRLSVALIELGFSWLPSFMSRLDSRWSELRAEVPWLKRKPSAYIRDHVRLTTQPVDPDDPAELLKVIDMVGPEMLMFSSDFPHWDFDSPARALPSALGEADRRAILSENARSFYQL